MRARPRLRGVLLQMNEPKYPEDFKGWKPLYQMHNNQYLILESPGGTREASIHLEDNDVVGIMNKVTGELIYDGNLRLKKILDLKL